jgi:hypothetical protein
VPTLSSILVCEEDHEVRIKGCTSIHNSSVVIDRIDDNISTEQLATVGIRDCVEVEITPVGGILLALDALGNGSRDLRPVCDNSYGFIESTVDECRFNFIGCRVKFTLNCTVFRCRVVGYPQTL